MMGTDPAYTDADRNTNPGACSMCDVENVELRNYSRNYGGYQGPFWLCALCQNTTASSRLSAGLPPDGHSAIITDVARLLHAAGLHGTRDRDGQMTSNDDSWPAEELVDLHFPMRPHHSDEYRCQKVGEDGYTRYERVMALLAEADLRCQTVSPSIQQRRALAGQPSGCGECANCQLAALRGPVE